jgi:hypothetical protein
MVFNYPENNSRLLERVFGAKKCVMLLCNGYLKHFSLSHIPSELHMTHTRVRLHAASIILIDVCFLNKTGMCSKNFNVTL